MSRRADVPAALVRGLGLVALVVLGWQVLRRGLAAVPLRGPGGSVVSLLAGADLIFHEGGHILFLYFGPFLHALGGSLTQVALPAACTAYFLARRQASSAAATMFWTGESLAGVAIYAADAQRMALPLLGEIHDWNYLLGRLGLLPWALPIGRALFGAAAVVMLGAVGLVLLDLLRVLNPPARADVPS